MNSAYLRAFSLVERLLIVRAADHYAADYYGSAFELDLCEAARSVAAGYLRTVTFVHGTVAVAEAVAAYLTEHPEALTRTARDRERGTYHRDAEWSRLITAAAQAYRAGNYDRAVCLVMDAATVQPGRSVEAYHRRISAARAAAGAR